MLSLALPMITVNLAMEVGSALPDFPVEQVVKENVGLIMEKFVDRRARLIFEHVSPDGTQPDTFDGRLINPGHGIECMWFVMSAARWLGETDLISRYIGDHAPEEGADCLLEFQAAKLNAFDVQAGTRIELGGGGAA
jgi:N-acylglucosamine 2-epimerase